MANYVVSTSFATCLTTELNSLADGALSAFSSTIDNGTNLNGLSDFFVNIGSINPTSNGAHVEIHIAITDGTNFEDGSANTLVVTMPITTGSSVKRAGRPNVVIPRGSYKVALRNRTGVTFPASGNTLSERRHDAKGG